MEIDERLAAHAAGELSPQEAAALEADLAGDAALRARFERIQRLDTMLAGLPEVEVPADFSARLRADLTREVRETAPVVDLASRRRTPRWMVAASGVAAAAAAVLGISTLGNLGGGDDAATTAMDAFEMDGAGDDAADMGIAAAPEAAPAAEPVYATGGVYDRDSLVSLGDDPDILVALGAAALDPSTTQLRFSDQLVGAAFGTSRSSGSSQATTGAGTAGGAADAGEAAAEDGAVSALDTAPVTEEAIANPVAACLPTIVDGSRVPLFADLGSFEDQDALVVVLGAPDADGDFARLEFWVLSPTTCNVLHFAQLG